jgi:hypothetical protein
MCRPLRCLNGGCALTNDHVVMSRPMSIRVQGTERNFELRLLLDPGSNRPWSAMRDFRVVRGPWLIF